MNANGFTEGFRLFRPLAAALALVGSVAQAQDVKTGALIDRVVCKDDASQTYALYLPSNYSAAKTWPVVLCFDPGARGRTGVERLQAAAEKLGYIVAGSNNSRNGPLWPELAAANAMAGDVFARFAVDARRVYTAGLSGGSRLALRIALAGKIRGVIACSAGMPDNVDIPEKPAFAIFGTTGILDFNYREMNRLDRDLESSGAAHHLEVLDGGHEWASSAAMMKALEWFDLQAMRDGVRAKDEAYIRAAWDARLAAIPAAPVQDAWIATRNAAADFKGLIDTSAEENKVKELGALRELKAWQKSEAALVRREEDILDDLANSATSGDATRMRKLSTELHSLVSAPADSPERRMASRVLSSFVTSIREMTRAYFDEKQYAEIAVLLAMMAEFQPGQPRTYYDLARARAFDGDKKGALAALKQAVDSGYTGAAQAEAEPAFAKIRGDAAFAGLLSQIKKTAAGP